MTDCIFCKLANKEIPTDIIYEDEKVTAFKDANPKAKIHYLFVPKTHIESVQTLGDDDDTLKDIFRAIRKVAKDEGFAETGYRVVTNVGADGGQSVHHLHFHVLAGEPIRFPGFDEN